MKLNKVLVISLCLLGLVSCDNGTSPSSEISSSNSSQSSLATSSNSISSSNEVSSNSASSSNESSSTSSSETSSSSSSQSSSQEVLPTSIGTTFKRSVIGVNEELKIDVVFTPSNTTAKNVRFKSSDPSTIKVDSSTGVIKGVASSKNTVGITISSLDSTKVTPITIYLKCSSNESEVNNDKLVVKLKQAMENEEDNIVSGTISVTSQTSSSEEMTFTNNFESYDNHTYNNIKDYSNKNYLDYIGFDDNYSYVVRYDENGKVTNTKKNDIIEDDQSSTFSSSIKRSVARTRSHLACILPYHYSSNYIYGVSNYLEDQFISPIFDKYNCDISSKDNTMTISYNKGDGLYKELYSLEISFENDNFKKIDYSHYAYYSNSLDENFNVIDSAKPVSYEIFSASLNSGVKQADTKEDKIVPSDFYFDNFSLNFYKSDDLNTPLTSFSRGDTIVYRLNEFSPSNAIDSIDRIYVESVSDESVLNIAVNKLALNAVGAGDCEVVLKSSKATYKAKLHVDIQKATGIKVSTIDESMLNTDYQLFSVEVEPFGGENDLEVSISKGEEYASLEYVDSISMYKLIGNSDMKESKGEVTILIQSKSNPQLKKEVNVTVMKSLTSKELFDVLTSNKYKSDNNSSYYNYYTELEFTSTLIEGKGYLGTYVIYRKQGTVFATFTFYYSISGGKISIVSSSCDPSSYCKDLKLQLNSPSGLSIYSQFTDICTDGEDDYTVSYVLNAVSKE